LVKTIQRRPFLSLFILSVILAAGVGFGIRVPVLEIGEHGPRVRVKPGDLLSLQYIQSMYGVLVEEKLRVETEGLVLYEVASSAAALEYLGLEKRGPHNVHRVLTGFFIPKASVGRHLLVLGKNRIRLADLNETGRAVHIRTARLFLWQYLIFKLESKII